MNLNVSSQDALFHVENRVGRAFYWISTGLAVLTALLQGLVTGLALMTEASTKWTFRFRIALVEHVWWTVVSILLLSSLVMVALSFISGNGGDAISVLALSSATFLAIVQYSLPAWQHRHYIRTRSLAWTGQSRTTIRKEKENFCGHAPQWQRLVERHAKELACLQPTPSDYYGWRLWPVGGISYNPADILSFVSTDSSTIGDTEKGQRPVGVYYNAEEGADKVSLLWGPDQGFRRVISRAVSSMPLGLLRSNPTTIDGYDGKGLTTAMGILGRNKGVQPGKLIFRQSSALSSHMESSSTWAPRPTKVLRSFYKATMQAQYGGLGDDYVNATVELALIMADMPYWASDKWLTQGLEHQSLQLNHFLAEHALVGAPDNERHAALYAHYESSYASMILSLNYMSAKMKGRRDSKTVNLGRPDLFCLGILLKARGFPEPSWWNAEAVRRAREEEKECLAPEYDWKCPMARLLGLDDWPPGFEDSPSIW